MNQAVKNNILERKIKGEYPSYLYIDKKIVDEVRWVDSKADATKLKVETALGLKNIFTLVAYRSEGHSNASFELVSSTVYVVERFVPRSNYRDFLQTYVKADGSCSLIWTTDICNAKQFNSLELALKACEGFEALFETMLPLHVVEVEV